MPIFRPRKFTFFPFLILFKRIESIDITPCVISFLVYTLKLSLVDLLHVEIGLLVVATDNLYFLCVFFFLFFVLHG